MYKLINNYFSTDFSNLFTYSSSEYILEVISLNYTNSTQDWNVDTIRIINDWNNLPLYNYCKFGNESLNTFKSALDIYHT